MKAKYINTFHPSGFPVTFEIEEGEKLKLVIERLTAYGFRPAINGDTWLRTPDGLPICPKHNAVMGKREKQGDTWYSHQVADPRTGEIHYCRGYQCKSGPGYDIDAAISVDDDPEPAQPPPPARPPARPQTAVSTTPTIPRPPARPPATLAAVQADADALNAMLYGHK